MKFRNMIMTVCNATALPFLAKKAFGNSFLRLYFMQFPKKRKYEIFLIVADVTLRSSNSL
jgi:hypothetical protein